MNKRSIVEPLISVIIPCYNQGEYLKNSLGSIRAQSFNNYEIIIVNDGSTDDETVRIIDVIEKNQPDVIVINKKNGGLSEARNSGVRVARGKYIVCLDADDKINPDYLKHTVGYFEKSKKSNLGFVTTWVQEFGDRSNVWKTEGYYPSKLMVMNLAHAGSMFTKTMWEKVGGYKKTMRGGYEDWEFWISAIEKGYSWGLIPKPLFNYRIKEESMLTGAFKRNIELYTKIVDLHPKLYEKYANEIALISANIIFGLRNDNYSQYVLLVESNKELIDARKKNREMDDLLASRIIKKAIYLRAIAQRTRNLFKKNH